LKIFPTWTQIENFETGVDSESGNVTQP